MKARREAKESAAPGEGAPSTEIIWLSEPSAQAILTAQLKLLGWSQQEIESAHDEIVRRERERQEQQRSAA